jgi:hypothetical protein
VRVFYWLAIHGSPPSGRRYATLKTVPDSFLLAIHSLTAAWVGPPHQSSKTIKAIQTQHFSNQT